jgi:hypothetical protein
MIQMPRTLFPSLVVSYMRCQVQHTVECLYRVAWCVKQDHLTPTIQSHGCHYPLAGYLTRKA